MFKPFSGVAVLFSLAGQNIFFEILSITRKKVVNYISLWPEKYQYPYCVPNDIETWQEVFFYFHFLLFFLQLKLI